MKTRFTLSRKTGPTSDIEAGNSNIRAELEKEFESLSQMDEVQLQARNADLKTLIAHYCTLTGRIDDRREKALNSSLQVLAICLTGLGLLLGNSESLGTIVLRLIAITLLVQIVLALVTAVVYYRQTSYNYPFLEIEDYGNNWKWFYYGNREILKIRARSFFRRQTKRKAEGYYLQGLLTYAVLFNRETLYSEVKGNIVQAYLLQVHNYFKNRFERELINIRKLAFVLNLIACGLGLWLFLFVGKTASVHEARLSNYEAGARREVLGLITSYGREVEIVPRPITLVPYRISDTSAGDRSDQKRELQ